MVQKVIPAVRSAFWHAKREVVLQLDGARAHWKASIQDQLRHAFNSGGYRMTVRQQPSNLPDLNVLDLGFFQSLQRKSDAIKSGGRLVDIVKSVTDAFKAYPQATLEHVWQRLFAAMECVLECRGGNDYILPHRGKDGAGKRRELE